MLLTTDTTSGNRAMIISARGMTASRSSLAVTTLTIQRSRETEWRSMRNRQKPSWVRSP